MRRIVGGLAVALLIAASPAAAQSAPDAPARPRFINQSSVVTPIGDDGGANARLRLAEQDQEAGRGPQAEAGFREVLDLLKADPVANAEQIAAVTSYLAMSIITQGRVDAEGPAREVEATAAHLGADHPAMQRASLVLGAIATMSGRPEEGVARLQALVDLAVLAGDRDMAGQISVLLAQAYRFLGREGEAREVLAVATQSPGVMSDLTRLKQAVAREDDVAIVTFADALLARPEAPYSVRVVAVTDKAAAFRRRAGPGDLIETEASLRAFLTDRAATTPIIEAMVMEALAMTLLVDAGDHPDTAETQEGLRLIAEVADRRETILGRDHSSAVGTRIDHGFWLSVVGRRDEALAIFDEVAARHDAAPGLMSEQRRGWLEVSRAMQLMLGQRFANGYGRLRDASRRLQTYALAPERRDAARQSLDEQSRVFGVQVQTGWIYASALERQRDAAD